jgi:hypothetical protein
MYLSKSDKLAGIPADYGERLSEMSGQDVYYELEPIINSLIETVNLLIDHGIHVDTELDRRPRELTADEEG